MLAVVFFLKTNLDKINYLREKYDANWKIIPPHITIVSPVIELSKQQIIEQVEIVANNFEPFPIRLAGITKTVDGCLFLMVKDGKEKIIHLHDQLYSGILSPYLPTIYHFAPHITLGEFERPNEIFLSDAVEEAQNLNLDINTTFDALTVIEGDGVNPAEIIKVINL